TSLIMPGAGEPNFDALEANPYMSRTQRREMEVKALLEKVNYELITLDTDFLAKVTNTTRAPNKHRDVMRAAETRKKRSKRPPRPEVKDEKDEDETAMIHSDGSDAEAESAAKKRPVKQQQLDNFRPSKRG